MTGPWSAWIRENMWTRDGPELCARVTAYSSVTAHWYDISCGDNFLKFVGSEAFTAPGSGSGGGVEGFRREVLA